MAVKAKLSQIVNSNPDQSNAAIIIGDIQKIPSNALSNNTESIYYRPVYNPATRETVILRQNTSNGNPNVPLNMNDRIATLGPNNKWIPTEFAKNIGGQSLITSITSTLGTSAAASFNVARNKAIQDNAKLTTGKALTTNQLTSATAAANVNSPSMTISTNTLGTSKTGSASQPAQGNSSPGDSSGTGGALPPESTRDSSGEGSIVGNRSAVRDAVSSVVQIDSLIGPGEEVKEGSGNLKYPLSFPDNMDFILFTEKSYGTKTFSSTTLTFNKRENKPTGNSVQLPLQTGISDANTVGWNEETFNPAQIAGSQLAIGGIQDGPGGFIGQIASVAEKMTNAKTDIERAIIAYFTEQAVGVQILPKIGGSIINPNTELLFQGPQLRSFNFSFRFTPRDKKESLEVKKIIRFFKSNMAARTTEGGIFLKSPKVFGIQFRHGGTNNKEHSGIGKIKDCALQACNVDYTPDGSYMSFVDGGMVSYTMNLQFMELEPIYAKDYNDGHAIGY